MLSEKEKPTCPFCDGKNVELYSSFGTAQLVRQYYCQNCKTVFESIRWSGTADASPEKTQGIQTVGVVGSGTMGSGIAQTFLQSGLSVTLYDIEDETLERNSRNIITNIEKMKVKGKITPEQAESANRNLKVSTKLTDLSGLDLIIEAVQEIKSLKIELFKKLDAVSDPETILATNTSSFSVTEFAANLNHPQRMIGIHFFNPAPLMPLIEIVKSQLTDQTTIDRTRDLFLLIKKRPVICKDTPGFIVNRIARSFYNESLRIVDEGLVTHEKVDRIMKKAGGFKMGPFELQDLIGIDINYNTTQSLFDNFQNESRFKPHYLQKEMILANRLGRKTGKGFYKYE
ncbi:3-hydroxyacyl-CoA dehydrogenase family protein [Peribacillus sp. TH27]|uniref:3-hydroxyacyl-CoA dehydrogenase family protein n=2 Tax=unclassified Peribacillus TaxID=2675266 RepID=UPI0019141048|nr:3-hydroxyacyl-CoA dehydrogenase family protein [Peribacillus sp. TH27]MBK5459089.1 3-hydroxybutyryl-CoA dehydrogenase [Peribacillus sp. TH27]